MKIYGGNVTRKAGVSTTSENILDAAVRETRRASGLGRSALTRRAGPVAGGRPAGHADRTAYE